MDIKILLVVIGLCFEAASAIWYYREVLRGKTRPHLFTFLVWSIVTTIAFFGQLVGGGGIGSWITAASALTVIGIAMLSFWFGTKDITKSDFLFLIAALVSIIPWLLLKDPFWSVVLVTLIDALAMVPTLRKTWKDPTTEPAGSWLLADVKILCGIGALAVYTPTTWLYPVQALVMNSILIGIVLIRGKLLRRRAI